MSGHGVDSLIDRILDEVPELTDEADALDYLRKWTRKEKMAPYDIQCYNIKDTVTIAGHDFNGLEGVIRHVELIGKEYYSGFECRVPQKFESCRDVHVGLLYENYPILYYCGEGDYMLLTTEKL